MEQLEELTGLLDDRKLGMASKFIEDLLGTTLTRCQGELGMIEAGR
jgi:hypothetical protein